MGKWDRLSGSMRESVVEGKDAVGSEGEGKKTTRVVYSKNHLNMK